MTYSETLQWMFGQLPMYQRQGKKAYKTDLTNTLKLVEHLGHPHQHFKSIHVAGTNGKGSTSSIMASILQEAGYKVGLYTSPHLKDFRERIRINGKPISKQFVLGFIRRNKSFFETQQLSFFEMTVGMAFDYFAKKQVDVAVIEVGLGGRLDSTNVISPEVSVITNIGFDHMEFLGNTLPLIAREKAGIIKSKTPVVIGEYHPETFPVFKEVAKAKSAPLIRGFEMEVSYETELLGAYQKKNIKTAVSAIRELSAFPVKEKHIELGLLRVTKNSGLLGRWQVLQKTPLVLVDTAHNREGLVPVLDQIMGLQFRRLHIVLGTVKDKKLDSILPLFPKTASYYFCQAQIPRALSAKVLKEKASDYGLHGLSFTSVQEAYEAARSGAQKEDVIFVGGSTFVVAEVL